jgi:pre-rRNA-processing protein IPI3
MAAELFASVSSEDDGALRVWDARTASEKWRNKAGASQARTLCRIGPDVLATAASRKSELHFFSLSKASVLPPHGRCSCWEPLTCLAVTGDGVYCVGGSGSGKLYVWETASGALLRFWEAHYSSVGVLAFTDDDLFLVSAEEHAYAKVWRLGDVLDLSDSSRSRAPQPFRVWAEHTLPVTDVAVGAGGPCSRVVTVSLDQSAKIWSLATGERLATVAFPAKCTAVVLEPAEQEMYVGCSDAVIYAVGLAAAPPSHWSSETERSHDSGGLEAAFRGHKQSITALSISSDGLLLVSGSADTTVRVWDVPSRTTLRQFAKHQGAVTNVISLGLSCSATLATRTALSTSVATPATRARSTAMLVKPFLKDTGVGSSAAAFSTPMKIGGEGPRTVGHEAWDGSLSDRGGSGVGSVAAGWMGMSSPTGWPDDTGVVPVSMEVDLGRLDRYQAQEGRWHPTSNGVGASGDGTDGDSDGVPLASQLAAMTAERDQWKKLATDLYAYASSEASETAVTHNGTS